MLTSSLHKHEANAAGEDFLFCFVLFCFEHGAFHHGTRMNQPTDFVCQPIRPRNRLNSEHRPGERASNFRSRRACVRRNQILSGHTGCLRSGTLTLKVTGRTPVAVSKPFI